MVLLEMFLTQPCPWRVKTKRSSETVKYGHHTTSFLSLYREGFQLPSEQVQLPCCLISLAIAHSGGWAYSWASPPSLASYSPMTHCVKLEAESGASHKWGKHCSWALSQTIFHFKPGHWTCSLFYLSLPNSWEDKPLPPDLDSLIFYLIPITRQEFTVQCSLNSTAG